MANTILNTKSLLKLEAQLKIADLSNSIAKDIVTIFEKSLAEAIEATFADFAKVKIQEYYSPYVNETNVQVIIRDKEQ